MKKKRDCSSARIYSSYLLHLGDYFLARPVHVILQILKNSKLTMGTAINIIPVLALITILRIFNINSNNALKHKCICYGADYKTFQF